MYNGSTIHWYVDTLCILMSSYQFCVITRLCLCSGQSTAQKTVFGFKISFKMSYNLVKYIQWRHLYKCWNTASHSGCWLENWQLINLYFQRHRLRIAEIFTRMTCTNLHIKEKINSSNTFVSLCNSWFSFTLRIITSQICWCGFRLLSVSLFLW